MKEEKARLCEQITSTRQELCQGPGTSEEGTHAWSLKGTTLVVTQFGI